MRDKYLSPEGQRGFAEMMLRTGCQLVFVLRDDGEAILAVTEEIGPTGIAKILFDAGEALSRGPQEIGRVTIEVPDDDDEVEVEHSEHVLSHTVRHDGIVKIEACDCCPPERVVQIFEQALREIREEVKRL